MLKNAGSLARLFVMYTLFSIWHSHRSRSPLFSPLCFFSLSSIKDKSVVFLVISLSRILACLLSVYHYFWKTFYIHTQAVRCVFFLSICMCVYLSLASGDLLLKQLSFGIFIVVNAWHDTIFVRIGRSFVRHVDSLFLYVLVSCDRLTSVRVCVSVCARFFRLFVDSSKIAFVSVCMCTLLLLSIEKKLCFSHAWKGPIE